jgi:predicted lipid-binding transport protein (Tim44 family)
VTDRPPGSTGAGYSGGMGRMILKTLGGILATWLGVTAIGWVFAMVKTFVIIGLIAAVVFIVVRVLAKRSRRTTT